MTGQDIVCEIAGTSENALIDKYDEEFVRYHYPDPTTLFGIMGGAVSCYEYERKLNEDKRQIILIDKKYLSDITNEMDKIFK
jgi:surfactin synthase thioesterase subunit